MANQLHWRSLLWVCNAIIVNYTPNTVSRSDICLIGPYAPNLEKYDKLREEKKQAQSQAQAQQELANKAQQQQQATSQQNAKDTPQIRTNVGLDQSGKTQKTAEEQKKAENIKKI